MLLLLTESCDRVWCAGLAGWVGCDHKARQYKEPVLLPVKSPLGRFVFIEPQHISAACSCPHACGYLVCVCHKGLGSWGGTLIVAKKEWLRLHDQGKIGEHGLL